MIDITLIQFAPFFIGLLLSFVIVHRMRLFSDSDMFFSRSEEEENENEKERGIVEIGGIAIFPILLIALCLSLGMPKLLIGNIEQTSEIENSGLRIMQVIAGSALLFIVGLKNDMHGTAWRVKFLALLCVACMFPATGLWVQNLQGVFGIYDIPAFIGIPMTVLIVMYLTETIAMLDDIDGLGVGLVTIMTGCFTFFAYKYGFCLGTMVSCALLGVALPYSLMKYFIPSWKKTLVGNGGSYIMGYMMSYLALSQIQQSGKTMPEGMLMIVAGITMVPMLDILRMIRLRVRENRSMLTPDRNQMQHRLIRTGISPTLTPVFIIAIILIFAAINTLWVVKLHDLTILAVIDIALWSIIQIGISYGIRKHEHQKSLEKWTMEYGRDAWEANIPVETIRRKHKNFGTMGLPQHVILGKEMDFIPDGMNGLQRNIKRLFDMFMSGILLIVFSPLFLLSYILIKLDDGGPAIYKQERIGRFGRPFFIYKFRSMRLDAEKSGPALSHAGGDDDPRLTKIGKFLRAHHLDELPQLWNVFFGDMAFIGYRPERKFFIDQIMEHDPRYSFLYQIRPGVTSYATLYNGYTDTMEKMLRRLSYDLYYLEHRSWWFDIRILWLTFASIVFGKKF